MSGLTVAPSGDSGLKVGPTGGGGTTDTIARAAAAKANTNINAITPQALEKIPAGGIVVTPQGLYENTGAEVTLSADDPQTGATVAAKGLTPFASSGETGTNLVVPPTAFADVEDPQLTEVTAWYTGQAITQTPDDIITYVSAGLKEWAWAAGDAQGTALALIARYTPSSAGGVVTTTASTVINLVPNAESLVLNRYILQAETPTTPITVPPNPAVNMVRWTVPDGTAVGQTIDVMRGSTAPAALNGKFLSATVDDVVVNEQGRWVTIVWTGAFWHVETNV